VGVVTHHQKLKPGQPVMLNIEADTQIRKKCLLINNIIIFVSPLFSAFNKIEVFVKAVCWRF